MISSIVGSLDINLTQQAIEIGIAAVILEFNLSIRISRINKWRMGCYNKLVFFLLIKKRREKLPLPIDM
ncbi:MAG: hypothetical protein Q27BB25_17800 [Blastomonas sp. CACIA14H2]|nr:MAG: hypothetical protein Q27BB25_17800 [Blastomonas sp. CACIA14H2]